MILAGDIGGTKSVLGVYSPEAGIESPLAQAKFQTAAYDGLEAMVTEFLSGLDVTIEKAVFGVGGTVKAGRATFTNLPFSVDREALKSVLKIPQVILLNDLEATAWSLPSLGVNDLYTLNKGERVEGGTMAVLAPGTGLGEAYLTWEGSSYQARASEGGHADFAPASQLEIELLSYLLKRYPHVSYERVCSGIGIPDIYAFLKARGHAPESAWLADELAEAQDPTPLIVKGALSQERPCPLCAATLEIFISALGAEAGNLALKVMATGGLYLAGGIPPRILPLLNAGRFMQSYLNKGRMSSLLARIPVQVMVAPDSAIRGAAWYGLQRF
ncbi:MAG: glucokinase [Desulfobacterales bacterium]